MRSVRARAAIGATLVVAVALVAAGLAVLLVLRANLIDQADLQVEVAAREVAGQLATGTPYGELELDDEEDHPVQVTDEEGRAVVVSKDLRAITGTGTSGVTPVPSASAGPPRRPATGTMPTMPTTTMTAAAPAGARSPPTTRTSPTAPPPSTAPPRTTVSPPSRRPPPTGSR